MNLEQRWKDHLQQLQDRGHIRSLCLPCGLDFTSNDYLGYGCGRRGPTPTFLDHLHLSSGMASRLLRGHHALWDQVEQLLATWHGSQSALVMTSGYVANEGLLSTVIQPHDWVASDALNHASIIDGLRLARPEKFIFRHNDLNHLQEGLAKARRENQPGREFFVVTESLFSMEGDRAPLTDIAKLAHHYGAHLIVDEAHATGCFGTQGGGLVDSLNLRDQVLATVHTGGKALGCSGAYICCSKLLKSLLINRCRHLTYTTALPPFIAARWLDIIPFVQADQEGRTLLEANAGYFRKKLHGVELETRGRDYIVPVLMKDNEKAMPVMKFLHGQGLDIRVIRPPTVPVGTTRLRIALHADHFPQELDLVAENLTLALGNKAGLPS